MASYVKRARKVAKVMVITIPIEIVETLNIKEGDYLQINLDKIGDKK